MALMDRREILQSFDPVSLETSLELVKLRAGHPAAPARLRSVSKRFRQLHHAQSLANYFLLCCRHLGLLSGAALGVGTPLRSVPTPTLYPISVRPERRLVIQMARLTSSRHHFALSSTSSVAAPFFSKGAATKLPFPKRSFRPPSRNLQMLNQVQHDGRRF